MTQQEIETFLTTEIEKLQKSAADLGLQCCANVSVFQANTSEVCHIMLSDKVSSAQLHGHVKGLGKAISQAVKDYPELSLLMLMDLVKKVTEVNKKEDDLSKRAANAENN